MPRTSRIVAVVVGVLLLHLLALWAIPTDVLHRVTQAIVPAELVVEMKTALPPARAPEPSQQPAPLPSLRVQNKAHEVQPVQRAESSAVTEQTGSGQLTTTPSTTAIGSMSAAPTSPHATATAPSTTVNVELPSKDAAYLNNPKPPYPKRSWQLHEQGKVVVRVWIGTDGRASQASVTSSSGYERLDLAAVNAALSWRYVPGKRAGVAEAMWFDIPVDWVLQ
jgi:protein TonB